MTRPLTRAPGALAVGAGRVGGGGHRFVTDVLGGLVLVAGLLAMAAGQPFLAVGLVVVLVGVLACATRPYETALALAFLTVAFPKAGIKVGDFPVPVLLFGSVLALGLLALTAERRTRRRPTTVLLVFCALMWVLVRVARTFGTTELGDKLAYVAWSTIPLVMLLVATSIELRDRRLATWMERGFLLAAGFAVVQFFWGIERTAVPGLTIAWGDSYREKHNVISGGETDYSKIMSTYQNGNIFGATAVVFLLVAVTRIARGRAGTHDRVLAAAAALAIVLSGSRAAVLAAVVGLALLALARGSTLRKVRIFALVAGAAVAGLVLQPALTDRYAVSGLVRSGGAGRVATWSAAMESMSPADWLVGARTPYGADGAIGLVTAHGLVGIALLFSAAWVLVVGRPQWRVVFAALAALAAVDSTYAYFPTWFIPALAAALPIVAAAGPPEGDGAADELPGAREAHETGARR
ncbi:hypothetical protein Cch01nite_33910 [Cellulomonas chitinilytica]|uniref:O-antigen ligase domain-containing protein n=1 Tax=Cellulomonas chitinilytica TaxID=398759 RepID=A0A919P5T9_9CELL|nr:hypothetical protein [Cellulomonas chitinilytica]GIG22667.1 hypothetical protein Cch01nite_33910 [Cellulomonas chitinilytica]